MKRAILFLCGSLFAGGCSVEHSLQRTRHWLHTSEVVDHHRVVRQEQWRLAFDSPIYIALPDNPFPEGLNLQVQETLRRELGQYFPLLKKGDIPESHAGALASARAQQIPFVIYPQLAGYHDRVSSIRELGESPAQLGAVGRDSLRLQLLLFDSTSQHLLDSAIVDSRNAWPVWLTWRQRLPEDLLPEALARYAASISARD